MPRAKVSTSATGIPEVGAVGMVKVSSLSLDPSNPRLGREEIAKKLSQSKILELMKDWALEELAVSFLESGFWPQEPLIGVLETLQGKPSLVIVEGNRRLAALTLLKRSLSGTPPSPKWKELAEKATPTERARVAFAEIPVYRAKDRKAVDAYLGFRHVTGVKEWNPAEKAAFIAHLIDDRKLSYTHVMRQIGSRTSAVRQLYIAFRILKQMDSLPGDISLEKVEEKFSVLYLSLRTQGVQEFLGVDIDAEPKDAQKPVRDLKSLVWYAKWLFGTDDRPPLFTDSRFVDQFGEILQSEEAIEYLKREAKPSFQVAFRTAGGDERETVRNIERAADNLEQALSTIHRYTRSKKARKAVARFASASKALLDHFPDLEATK